MNFFNPDDFPALPPLADHWESIRAEFDAIEDRDIPWPEPIHNGLWTVIGLRFQDRDLPAKALCPITSTLCDAIPGLQTCGFSIMRPGCEITPHEGYTSTVLRAHLGLYTNPDSGLKVGDEERSWSAGELLVFDDTAMHSAWNRGETSRVILLLDFRKAPDA